ncbi:hypothetical protein LQT97_09845 [Brucella pseudogrignonensis]|uniref:hypothetical protein n=1 Tax=Brucella pseudogrignonensis TaxID=419475 RepID=UPI001E51F176|nr:hypothetical protein [Brucella pseudogrignonensis]MCD4511540.1 hypothetical protein [Brucella pseudogrignonensis]
MVNFNYVPMNWFWKADDGRIYSSAAQSLINSDDDVYVAWCLENTPTRWPVDDDGNQTDDALEWVLVREGLRLWPVVETEPDLAAVKAALKAKIDTDAEIERLKYITPGNGQAMTYQQKVTEAQAFKAAASPVETNYPILSSEVGITAETLGEVADIVLAAFAQWQQIGAAIESIRLGAKRDIDAAQDEAAARAVVNAIVWPQPAL